MSYHVEVPRSEFKELPDRILVREDGYLGAYKFYGEPIVDYWYVPEQDAPQDALEKRIDELCQENERLRKAKETAMDDAKSIGVMLIHARDENAKLQKVCKVMHDHIKESCDVCDEYYCSSWDEDNECCVFDSYMRELGVE